MEGGGKLNAKHYYMQFNVGDWLKDPKVSLLKPATRGIWMDAICAMHELDQCGQISGQVTDLARLCRCTPNEMRVALDDLKARNAADVDERDGYVTLTNRRMRRAWTDRKSSRDRKKRSRAAKSARDVTPDVTEVSHDITINRDRSPLSPPSGGACEVEKVNGMRMRRLTARERDQLAFQAALDEVTRELAARRNGGDGHDG